MSGDWVTKLLTFGTVLAILGSYLILKVNGVDTADFLTLLGTLGAFSAAGVGAGAYKEARAAKHQTNGGGPIDSRLSNIENKLSELGTDANKADDANGSHLY